MAILVSAATGNLTAAATWKVVHAGTFQTLRATQETGVTALNNTTQASTNFTVAANITVDGILLKHTNTLAGANQSVTVSLYNATTATTVATATTVQAGYNTLPESISTGTTTTGVVLTPGNWFQFLFSGGFAVTTGNNYQIRITSAGTANQNSFYRRSATAADWTFGLRTTTTAAPANGDILLIAGAAGATSRTDYTVTNDNTNAALLLGNGTAGTAGIEVSYGSKLVNGTTASTNYSLRVSGDFQLNAGSTFECGTGASPFPQSSTATFEIYQPANGRFSLITRSSVNGQTSVTCYENQTNKRLQYSLLTSGIAAAATSCSVANANATNWKSGDEIVVGTTARNYQQVEYRTMSANEAGGTVSVSAAFTNAHDRYHDAKSQIAVPVANLTKNIKIKGTSTTLRAGNWQTGNFTTINLYGVEISNFGRIPITQEYRDDKNGSPQEPSCYLVDVVLKDYTDGIRTVNYNPKDFVINNLTAARSLATSSWCVLIDNINSTNLLTNWYFTFDKILSFGGTGAISGGVFFSPVDYVGNGNTNWIVSSSSTPYYNIYINGIDANVANTDPFTWLGTTNDLYAPWGDQSLGTSGWYWVTDYQATISGCTGNGASIQYLTPKIDNVWSIKNTQYGFYYEVINAQNFDNHNSQENTLALYYLLNPSSINKVIVSGWSAISTTNATTNIYRFMSGSYGSFVISDFYGGVAGTGSASNFIVPVTLTGAYRSNFNVSYDFSAVTSSTITMTKIQLSGNNGNNFATNQSKIPIKDNSGNVWTFIKDGVMYPDSVNYYLTAPSTVIDSNGYNATQSPPKTVVCPSGKKLKVSVWVYSTTSAGSGTTTLNCNVASSASSTTTLGSWVQLSTTMTSAAAVDTFVSYTISNSGSVIITKISDWYVEVI